MATDPPIAIVLDLDGTLVDTNYQHAIAWHRALSAHEADGEAYGEPIGEVLPMHSSIELLRGLAGRRR